MSEIQRDEEKQVEPVLQTETTQERNLRSGRIARGTGFEVSNTALTRAQVQQIVTALCDSPELISEVVAPAIEGALEQREESSGSYKKYLIGWLITCCVFVAVWIVVAYVATPSGPTAFSAKQEAAIASLKKQPGIVVSEARVQDGVLHVWGLKDSHANLPKLETRAVTHFEPFVALSPRAIEQRARAVAELGDENAVQVTNNRLFVGGPLSLASARALRSLDIAGLGLEKIDLSRAQLSIKPLIASWNRRLQRMPLMFDARQIRPEWPTVVDDQLKVISEVIHEIPEGALRFEVQPWVGPKASARTKQLMLKRVIAVRKKLRDYGVPSVAGRNAESFPLGFEGEQGETAVTIRVGLTH